MKKLWISEKFGLPLEFVTSTQAILAKKRVGKSYTASVEAEELLKLGQQICAIDPTGAWYGLKSSADGKSPGYPIVVFGGERGDVPLEESAGEIVANFLIEQRASIIVDLSLFRKAAMNRFMAEFLENLYHKNREAMHLFVDEADLFAPQKPFSGQERTLGAMEDIVRRGGIRGIGCTLITQRTAVINKDVLTQVGLLTVLRLSHPGDIKPISEWVGVHGEQSQYEEMKASLPSLERGRAWVWAPEWDMFEQLAIRQRETFDSGATPKPGESKRRPKVVAEIDLQNLGEKIKATIESAKANDPRALRSEIAKLKQELLKRPAEVKSVVEQKLVEVPVLKDEQIARLRDAISEVIQFGNTIQTAIAQVRNAPRPQAATSAARPTIVPPRATASNSAAQQNFANGELTGPERKILVALAELLSIGKEHAPKNMVAAWAGYSPIGGAFGNPIGALRSKGLIDYPQGGVVTLTEAGRRVAGEYPPPTQQEIWQRIERTCTGPEQKILRALLDHAGEGEISKVELAEKSGYSPVGGAFGNPIGALRTKGLLDYPRQGFVQAADWLFIA